MKDYQKLIEELKMTNPGLTLPPPSMEELGIKYLEIIPGEKIKAILPFKEKFTNPAGLYQGGFLTAALDEVFGPLAFITHKAPCLTLSLNVTFLKAFIPSMKECIIEAQILKETKQFLFMRGEVLTHNGDILAHAESHVTKALK